MIPKENLDYDEEELRMTVEYGKIIEQSGEVRRYAYGPRTALLVGDLVHGFYYRDQINGIDRCSSSELDWTKHLKEQMTDRHFTREEVADIVDNGIFYFDKGWHYIKEIDGHAARVVRRGGKLVTVVWHGNNPREICPDSATAAYRERKKS